MNESFEPLNELSGNSDGIEPVEIIASQVSVRGRGLKYLESDHQNFVAGGDNCLCPSSSGFDAMKERAQVSLLAM
ncbi:MAG: hypothetical protein JWQ87_3545 [Candidatus Sulfotelmatobacter sp.]|nr:hypothetical protein [Candidatus Sulfotelmatobacter sp.]